ncbi:MAG: Tol-Pal system beta propeller repeat protein TolB [Acidobacteria bacterium]|nr:MAG: Tol-Pal system beta propeller repeat protein TolB [Acidobacteriota bacterium]
MRHLEKKLLPLPALLILLGGMTVGLAPAARQESPSQAQTPPSEPPIPSVPIIRIVGPAKPKIPIAIPAFQASADGRARDLAKETRDTLRDDLDFSGYFSIVPEEYHKLVRPDSGGHIPFKEWLGVGAEDLMMGELHLEASNLVCEGRLYDTSDQKVLFGKLYRGEPDLARVIAHRMSNEIVQQHTGQPGIALTRIAFVSQVGKAKEIYVMDYDGARSKRITGNGSINLSPAWSPDGKEIAFVSYRTGTPELMIISNDGALRAAFPQQGELNSAPSWSPDGSAVAFSSSRDGNAEIYLLRLSDRSLKRLTNNDGIDTSPTWSPDGRQIAFTSDRAGSPHIYVMAADGGGVHNVTPEVSYCDAASWSPLGDKIAFTARVAGGFDIFVRDVKAYEADPRSGPIGRLTENSNINEWPRWSPDGRHLAFASNRTGNFDIYTMDLDGSHLRRLTHGGNSYSPAWSR